ncbi:MAG TPA: DUF6763 family protein [Steroidobacteraceae bacterium]|nr:DUF6763 family protein [Steroidobacteraceae bacterium]
MAREYEPVVGQWYENVDESDSFRVLSIDEDAELIEIEYLDGDIEEIDLETWRELDLDKIEEPEGWAASREEEEEDDDEDLDEDWDEDEDEDEDDEDDDEDDEDEDWDEEAGESDRY